MAVSVTFNPKKLHELSRPYRHDPIALHRIAQLAGRWRADYQAAFEAFAKAAYPS